MYYYIFLSMDASKVGDCHVARKHNAKRALVAGTNAIGLMTVLA